MWYFNECIEKLHHYLISVSVEGFTLQTDVQEKHFVAKYIHICIYICTLLHLIACFVVYTVIRRAFNASSKAIVEPIILPWG